MLTRSIDPDVLGPTFDEKIFRAGKRISIAFAVAALGLSALDLTNEGAITAFAAAIHDSRLSYNDLPGHILAGIHQISIYEDRSSVIVAIPRDAQIHAPKSASLQRPVATLDRPVKPARAAAADAAPVKNSAAVAELSAARHLDAIEMAMTQPAGSLRSNMFALASSPESTAIAPTPAVAVNQDIAKQDIKAETPPQVPLAPAAADVPRVQLASLDLASLPGATATPEPIRISLPPLSMVPMPIPAPGVPPPSPAQRLRLEGKDYAKAERCLANAVYWEARSEPIRGQMAVAQVVLNRVFSPFYPNDVCSVVYQNASRHLACQFTFACDGKRKVINERGAWARANRIAKQTLDGQIYVAEVAKSTHYHAAYVHPIWAREMRRLAHYGLHSFYRPYAWGNGADEPVWGKTALAKVDLKGKKK